MGLEANLALEGRPALQLALGIQREDRLIDGKGKTAIGCTLSPTRNGDRAAGPLHIAPKALLNAPLKMGDFEVGFSGQCVFPWFRRADTQLDFHMWHLDETGHLSKPVILWTSIHNQRH